MPSVYHVKSGDTLYDIALRTYGSASFAIKLIQDNPAITSLNFDFSTSPGMMLVWDESQKIISTSVITPASVPVPSNIQSYTGRYGQTIYDVCLQLYGDLGYLFKLMTDNEISSLNIGTVAGIQFIFDSSLISDRSIFDRNDDDNVIYCTAQPNQISNTSGAYNIDYSEDYDI
jgi:hypothetical protein